MQRHLDVAELTWCTPHYVLKVLGAGRLGRRSERTGPSSAESKQGSHAGYAGVRLWAMVSGSATANVQR